jgi:hypothetical protein
MSAVAPIPGRLREQDAAEARRARLRARAAADPKTQREACGGAKGELPRSDGRRRRGST